jgi:hypothetical protein
MITKASTHPCQFVSHQQNSLEFIGESERPCFLPGNGRDFSGRKSMTYQDEDSEEYDNNGSCNEQLLTRKYRGRKEKH